MSGKRRVAAQVLGVSLLIPTLVCVVGIPTARWRLREPCGVPGADAQALFDYMSFYACAEAVPKVAKASFLLMWLLLLISLLASTADMFFVPQLDALSQDLHLSEDVAGVTLLALGNGMPDVMTATSAINKADDFALTMGEFLGAANFILALVLGCVLLCNKGPTTVDAAPFIRDAIGYSIVLAVMVAVTWDGTVHVVEALVFFAVYFVYVAEVMVFGRCQRCRASTTSGAMADSRELEFTNSAAVLLDQEAPCETELEVYSPQLPSLENESSAGELEASPKPMRQQIADDIRFVLLESDVETEDESALSLTNVGNNDPLEGLDARGVEGLLLVQLVMELPFTFARHVSIPAANWNSKRRRLAAICPAFGLQIGLLSFGGWEAFQIRFRGLPIWLGCAILGIVLGAIMLAYSSPHRRPRWHALLLIFAFACTIGWFNLLANECVAVLETFGLNSGLSSSVLGITVLSWGNSVGDLVADITIARQGKSKTAVAGCFGSPLLSDLLGLGIALLSYNLSNGPLHVHLSLQNKLAAAFLSMSILLTVVVFAWFRFSCPRNFGFVLFGVYACFMVVSVIVEAKKHSA